jgi:hypothetical protein
MNEPTFDKYGSPTEETLEAIRTWPGTDPYPWLKFCRDCWDENYGKIDWDLEEGNLIQARFITGGWSENETIISAMMQNIILWGRCWVSSHRGGLYVFEEPGR